MTPRLALVMAFSPASLPPVQTATLSVPLRAAILRTSQEFPFSFRTPAGCPTLASMPPVKGGRSSGFQQPREPAGHLLLGARRPSTCGPEMLLGWSSAVVEVSRGQEEGEPKETGVIETFACFLSCISGYWLQHIIPNHFLRKNSSGLTLANSTPERPPPPPQLPPTAAAPTAGAICELTGVASAVARAIQAGEAGGGAEGVEQLKLLMEM